MHVERVRGMDSLLPSCACPIFACAGVERPVFRLLPATLSGWRQVEAGKAKEEAKKVAAEAAAKEEQQLQHALQARGLRMGGFLDNALEKQCVGPNAGARVWYDPEGDELHWPVMLLYPEVSQSDFIQVRS